MPPEKRIGIPAGAGYGRFTICRVTLEVPGYPEYYWFLLNVEEYELKKHLYGWDGRVSFLNSWNEGRDCSEKIYVSYDSTDMACKAGDIEKAEYGHPKEDAGAPIVNYSIAYDVNNQKPLLYESCPGSIADVSRLQYVLEKLQAFNAHPGSDDILCLCGFIFASYDLQVNRTYILVSGHTLLCGECFLSSFVI